MKIALLNLPFDSNYGGNLQRYALVKILQGMGCEVEHVFLMYHQKIVWYKKPYIYAKRIMRRILLNDKNPILNRNYIKRKSLINSNALMFYKKYVPHTMMITSKKQIKNLQSYDAYIVGSDQVWRKKIANEFGLETYFFDFLKENKAPRYAYAVSLGTSENELSTKEISILAQLYNKFSKVSVREKSGLSLLKQYGWNNPNPEQCLDPTLLLNREDYNALIKAGDTYPCDGNLFCYILDNRPEINDFIATESQKRGLKPFKIFFGQDGQTMTIEQWLRCFRDSEFIITDSYHGTIFSIIFNKPHITLKNKFRGNARIEDLDSIFTKNEDNDLLTNSNFERLRNNSYKFLNNIANGY